MSILPPDSLHGFTVYMIGVKGSGMAVLAEFLVSHGAIVSGSDVPDEFYTDRILKRAGVPVRAGFDSGNVPREVDVVVYSAAYDPQTHVELVAARERRLPIVTYPEMLGELSRRCKSIGISGVHGKTTTTMMVAAIVRELSLPGSVIAGGASTATDAPASVVQGDRFFVAETCEWRRHFLSFSPSVLVVTSVEADHLDYFKDGADVEDAFVEYAQRLPQSGEVLFCADDPGASRVARRVAETRGDIRLVPYGFSATGEGRLSDLRFSDGLVMFRAGETDLELHVPGEHNVLNAAAAAMVTHRLAAEFGGPSATRRDIEGAIRMALGRFTGSRRRSEVIGRKAGIIVLDDYAHHPTAIRATLEGFRQFYTGRRLIVDFMSHTYSRTRALAEQFGEALSVADVVILHDIYASARETNQGGIDGTILVDPTAAAAKRRGHACEVHYEADVMSTVPFVRSIVKSGDLFVTMGAGDNWRIGRALLGQLGADEETEAVR